MSKDLPLSFLLGIPSLDAAHLALLEQFDALEQEIINGDSFTVKRLMIEAYTNLSVHFVSEENIMISVKYPNTEGHAQEHSLILMLFESIMSLRPEDDAYLMITSLRLALKDHILSSDVPMANYYHSKETFDKCRFFVRRNNTPTPN